MMQAIAKYPPIAVLVGACGFGLGIAGVTGIHAMLNDPTLLLVNKKSNPYPWTAMDQQKNIKFYSVNFKSKVEGEAKKGYREDL